MQEILGVRALSKHYGSQAILHNIDISLDAGQVYGLIGLNGAGKTTLIKCILDLQRADSGTIEIFTHSSHNTAARSQLIYLPEKFQAPDYMTGQCYLRYIADAYHQQQPLSSEDFNADVGRYCQQLDLPLAALQKPVKTFSKGMTQKLAIVGCLLSGKPLLILDEPMSGLDPKARALFRTVIEQLKAAGKTVLLCSHILTDIESLCDQVSILHAGQLKFTGTPNACCEHFATQTLEGAFLAAIV